MDRVGDGSVGPMPNELLSLWARRNDSRPSRGRSERRERIGLKAEQ